MIAGSRVTHSVSKGRLASSALFVMAATLGSTLLGFTREVVNARYYGTRWEMDAFLAAAVIPIILFGVFNGALLRALVPTFSEYIDTWSPLGDFVILLKTIPAEIRKDGAH